MSDIQVERWYSAFTDSLINKVAFNEEFEAPFVTCVAEDTLKEPLDIYHANMWEGLVDFLYETFPAVKAMIGDDFYRQVVLQFTEHYRADSPYISDLQYEFKEYFRSHFSDAPIVGELAEFDWQVILANLNPLRYQLHSLQQIASEPRVRKYRCKYPTFDIRQLLLKDIPIPQEIEEKERYYGIWRQADGLHVIELPL